MRTNPHRTQRRNIVNAARQLGMSVPALGQRIQDGDVKTEHHGGYTFVSLEEIDRLRAAREDERKADEAAESARMGQEQREADGAFIAREMSYLQELAEKYGYTPITED